MEFDSDLVDEALRCSMSDVFSDWLVVWFIATYHLSPVNICSSCRAKGFVVRRSE